MNRYLSVVAGITLMFLSCKKERADIYPENSPQLDRTEIFVAPYIGSNARSVLLILNERGDTLKLKDIDTSVGDFRKWIINGKAYYSYFVHNTGFYSIPQVPYAAGYRVVTDTSFRELKRLTLLSHNGINGTTQPALENHDFLVLGENHFITLAYYEQAVNNIPAHLSPAAGIRVATPVIQEVLNDKVVWQWVGSEYPELYETSVEGNEYSNASRVADYLHVNSMWIDIKDGNLLISCRNSNQLIKLNRHGEGIIWQLGGINSDFEVPTVMQFLRQHNASYINNGKTLMLLDNGHIDERNYSRVLELDLDENTRKIMAIREFEIPAPFIRFAGSVQKFGDRYFIGSGVNPGNAGYALEVNRLTGEKTIELSFDLGSYRAYKYTSSLQP